MGQAASCSDMFTDDELRREYYRMLRRERYQEEQKKRHGVISLDAAGYNTHFLSPKGFYESGTETAMVKRLYTDILHEELARLPAWDRRMIGLLYFSGRTVRDTARILGCSRGKIFLYRKKALEKIKRRFEAEDIKESMG